MVHLKFHSVTFKQKSLTEFTNWLIFSLQKFTCQQAIEYLNQLTIINLPHQLKFAISLKKFAAILVILQTGVPDMSKDDNNLSLTIRLVP